MFDVAVHFSFIKARASSAGHTAVEVEHAVLKTRLQIRLFEAGIRQIIRFVMVVMLLVINTVL